MIKVDLLRDKSIAVISPQGALKAGDFQAAAQTVDPFIAEHGKLKGVLIDAPAFDGWNSFGALIEHLKFVRDHQRQVERVAAVTDSAFLRIAPKIAEHFARPEIRVFGRNEMSQALHWLETGE